MHRLIAIVIGLALTVQSAWPQVPAREVKLPKDKAILLAVPVTISSATAKAGDQIELPLARALVQDGVTIFPEGAVLRLKVKRARPAALHCKSGKLEFEEPQVLFPDGTSVNTRVALMGPYPVSLIADRIPKQPDGDPLWMDIVFAPLLIFLWPLLLPDGGNKCAPGMYGRDIAIPAGWVIALSLRSSHKVRMP